MKEINIEILMKVVSTHCLLYYIMLNVTNEIIMDTNYV